MSNLQLNITSEIIVKYETSHIDPFHSMLLPKHFSGYILLSTYLLKFTKDPPPTTTHTHRNTNYKNCKVMGKCLIMFCLKYMSFYTRTPNSVRQEILDNPPRLAPEVLQKLLSEAYHPLSKQLSTLKEEDYEGIVKGVGGYGSGVIG